MKMKHNVKILFILLFVIVTLLLLTNKVEAANANISCSGTGTVNEPIKITVTGTGVQWNLKLLVDGNQIASSSELENYESNKNISFSGTYTPTTQGNKTVTLVGSVTEFSDGTTKTDFTSKTITVNPKVEPAPEPTPEPTPDPKPDPDPQPETPAKATITKLVVAGNIYNNPGKDITVKLGNEVSEAKIEVTTSNGESYTIDKGNTVKLEEGTNMVYITLASGNKYTVRIRREAKEDDTPNIIDEPDEKEEVKVGLKSLLVKGVTEDGEEIELSYAPEFFSEIYEYQMLLDETLSHITKLDIQAIGLQNDFIIDITGNEELKEGENTITITVKSQDGKTTATYTMVVMKEAKVEEIMAPVEVEKEEEENTQGNITQKIVITIVTSMIAIMGIVFAVIEYRYQKTHKKEKEQNIEKEVEVSYSEIDMGTEEKEQEEMGEVPFATIGFENEVDKEDVLKEESKFQEIVDQSNEVEEQLKKQEKSKRGKHF